MKAALAVTFAAVLGLGWSLHSANAALARQQQTVAEQRQQLETLRTALADKSKHETLALQERCGTQAEKVFRQLGYTFNPTNGVDSNILQSHFNPQLNKCFMTIEANTFKSGQFTIRFLLDAYEQREYAEYTWMSDKVQKYWEVRPIACKEVPVSGPEQLCQSDEEYRAIVKRYME